MANRLRVILAAIALMACSGMAMAQADDAVVPSATQAYQRGAYYYGSDCGGSSVPGARHAGSEAGVILGGQVSIVGSMNCDDRRHALAIYRDGFEGKVGVKYDWFNPNGGGFGSVTPVREYSQNGLRCRDFQETSNLGAKAGARRASACRQGDGNWHIE